MSETRGVTVWMTGLPGSGKTTIALVLEKKLRAMGRNIEILDGDEVRKGLSSDLGFSKEDRQRHAKRVTYVAKVLTRNEVIVLVGLISPFRAFRQYARDEIGEFIEVFVDTSLEECIERDPKGLYKMAMDGKIKDLTGLQDPYEAPEDPELVIPTEDVTVEQAADMVMDQLRTQGYL
ncbi:MAG: adenylyl-sulfate kinase [Candidatus Thermoplasmatota archaeon]|nr:adenylyl-sulfate kinase [Candidatus Thermoplasmatota archaeon]